MPNDRTGDQPILAEDLTPESDRARMIEAVLREQEAKEVSRRSVARQRGTTIPRVAATVLLGLAALWIWFAPPRWIEFSAPPTLSLQVEEAGLRMAMYLQAQRVERFRRDRGRLPDVIEEAGEPLSGVAYARLDARTFRLTGQGDRLFLTYHSTDSLAAFAAPLADQMGDVP